MEQNQQSSAEQYSEQIEQLMELGRTQGYLTYAEINDLLPEDVIDPEYYDKLLQTLQHDAGIPVLDEAPESDEMMLNDTIPDEDAVEEATQILSNVESEIGRTTDPVRMYMREMGTVDLLTREDEISIAKRIEEGIDEVQTAIAAYPYAQDRLYGRFQIPHLTKSVLLLPLHLHPESCHSTSFRHFPVLHPEPEYPHHAVKSATTYRNTLDRSHLPEVSH